MHKLMVKIGLDVYSKGFETGAAFTKSDGYRGFIRRCPWYNCYRRRK